MTTTELPLDLDEPVTDDGIRWLNYFNGRVLSAEDLRTEQQAIDRARRQLGQAIGRGVVAGFRVREEVLTSTPGAPILTVSLGLALNEGGQAIELRRDVTVGLIRVDQPTSGTSPAFARCDVVLPGTAGLGVYVLTVEPAAADAGKAVVAGLGNQSAACNVAYSVEGVRFGLVPVPLEAGDLAEPDLLRNRIAYRMFGRTGSVEAALVKDPFVGPAPSSLLDDLREACFGTTRVPLCVLYWKPIAGIVFIDTWAVRRRPEPLSTAVGPAAVADPSLAEGEARFRQFQDHVSDLRRPGVSPSGVTALSRFEHLPPAGLLPLATSGFKGFQLPHFFDGLTATDEVLIEGAKLPSLLRASFGYPPITLASHEAIRVYLVRENQAAALHPYAVFANGHLPYQGDARFDLAYWNLSNYAECC